MKPCVHRWATADPAVFRCDNTEDLIHSGFVPELICQVCPFAKEIRGDFFAQTAAISARTKSAVVPKPCGGCHEVQRRETDSLQFVYPYWHGGAQGDELRWSMRSIEKFYTGKATILLIGDKPDWYTGSYLPQTRVQKHTPNRGFRDMLAKVRTMADHEATASHFVWMMDDIYFIRPVDLEALETPRADRWRPNDGNGWGRRKNNTMRVLAERGYATHDYATHLPHVVEKDKLAALLEAFELDQNTLLWEVLYGNVNRVSPQPVRPFLRRLWKPHSPEEYQQLTAAASIVNNTNDAWCEGLRAYLMALLPEPCSVESGGAPQTLRTYRTPRPKRVVKRRPVHTHRAYLERQEAQQ